MKKIILCTAVMIISGCSTLTEQQLAGSGQWKQLGELDGQKGLHLKAKPELMQLDVVSEAALEEYRQGYKLGIAEFCQPDAAFIRGGNGTKYQGQCAGMDNEDAVVQRWLDGLERFDTEQFIYSIATD